MFNCNTKNKINIYTSKQKTKTNDLMVKGQLFLIEDFQLLNIEGTREGEKHH